MTHLLSVGDALQLGPQFLDLLVMISDLIINVEQLPYKRPQINQSQINSAETIRNKTTNRHLEQEEITHQLLLSKQKLSLRAIKDIISKNNTCSCCF